MYYMYSNGTHSSSARVHSKFKVLYFFTEPRLCNTMRNTFPQNEFDPILTHLLAPRSVNYTESQ